MALTESRALAILTGQLTGFSASSRSKQVRVGIGDDCAALRPGKSLQVVSVDACQEGAHFLWEWMKPEDVAHKSFHAALSDIPAMGASPTAALCQLTLSERVTARWLERFASEQAAIARKTKTPLVGGNVCRGREVAVVTTVMGEALDDQLVLRRGARAGDEIWLIGDVGLARAGYLALRAGMRSKRLELEACLTAFRRPTAQWRRGPSLVGRATACLDVSDGLRRDAGSLARASGVRLVLERGLLEATLRRELTVIAPLLGESALELALFGGEDYALLCTGPARHRPRFARAIGVVEEGTGVFLRSENRIVALRGGFEHGSRTKTARL